MPSEESKNRAALKRNRILIVDDHPVVRQGLKVALAQDAELVVCGEAGTYQEAILAITSLIPDLLLLDLDLEGGSGLDLIKVVREPYPQIQMLVLSMFDEDLYAERVLKAGASGYLMKNESPERLIEAIHSVLAGKIVVSNKIASKALAHYAGKQPGAALSPVETLTDRELEVFRLLGQGGNSRFIAKTFSLSVKTVEAHIAHIKQKFGLSSGGELQHRAILWTERRRIGEVEN